MQRLLLLSCGKRKRLDSAPLPALERYDGPSFRVVRRYCVTHPALKPAIYILSAKFGLIPADQPIPYYDQRLTPERARELRPAVQETLARVLSQQEYTGIYFALGRDYAQTLEGFMAPSPAKSLIMVASGSQGRRLAQLHDWLYGPQALVTANTLKTKTVRQPGPSRNNLRFGRLKITLTMDQALACARHALAVDSHGSDHFYSWYVLLDGKRIAPKWLVSQLSGLPRSAFTTHEALRALEQIGIPTHRSALS